VQLAGATVLATGMWLTGWANWAWVRPLTCRRSARVLTGMSAGTLVVTMVLALDWSLGEATGFPHLPLPWMVAIHGVGNAFGFGLCGILAWRELTRE
jgi:hypothetical protein